MKFLYSGNYRRQILIKEPIKGLSKRGQSKRTNHTQMQISRDQISRLKNAVDTAEIKLRGGSIITDYNGLVQGGKVVAETGLKTWDTGLTIVQSGNVFGELALAGHSAKESLVEWQKGHYLCCVCSGISCSFFVVGAIASICPGGFGVWQVCTKGGSLSKAVTYSCRQVTGGRGL